MKLLAVTFLVGGLLLPWRISFNFTVAEDVPVPPGATLGDFVIEEAPVLLDLPVDEGMGDRYILVSIAEQKLWAYENGARILEAAVSTGRPGYETPKGKFAIENKAPTAYSKIAKLYMPFWMAFHYNGVNWLGFHELPEWPGGIKEGADHLGQPFSSGCIRLGVGPAEQLYNWAQVGDKVLVY
jgi:lipoprotein-anchoring transpeptidase ErfK/SrfK